MTMPGFWLLCYVKFCCCLTVVHTLDMIYTLGFGAWRSQILGWCLVCESCVCKESLLDCTAAKQKQKPTVKTTRNEYHNTNDVWGPKQYEVLYSTSHVWGPKQCEVFYITNRVWDPFSCIFSSGHKPTIIRTQVRRVATLTYQRNVVFGQSTSNLLLNASLPHTSCFLSVIICVHLNWKWLFSLPPHY